MYSRHSTLSCFAQDPEASPEEIDELIARQFSAIESGLSDACPAVRAAVVSGLCQLLNDFWELIPAPVVAGNIKRLTSKALAILTDDKHHLKLNTSSICSSKSDAGIMEVQHTEAIDVYGGF